MNLPRDKPLNSRYKSIKEKLEKVAKCTVDILSRACELSDNVVILTVSDSETDWVNQSIQNFYPHMAKVFAELDIRKICAQNVDEKYLNQFLTEDGKKFNK